MRNLIFFCVTLFSSITVLSQGHGEVIYKIKTNQNIKIQKSNEEKLSQMALKVRQLHDEAKEIAEDFELRLSFNKNRSYYELLEHMELSKKKGLSYRVAKIQYETKGRFYYEFGKDEILEEKTYLGENFLIRRNIRTSDWKLLNEKEKIGKYNCYKAERFYEFDTRKGMVKQKQIVWYTPDIPIPFGPAEFVGFPGLVLKVKKGGVVIYAQEINLKNRVKVKSKNSLDLKKINEEEFREIVKKNVVKIESRRN
ncbi:GLPGLI family protein [Tenacibaculum xiamenense]|uniref:GLPGLI family protein n=1 Tax=Tenacibaculum xiamenense TaxID=1261553 RepID=UPI003895A906